MTEFRNLPQSLIAEQNDELLLATATEASRITVKRLKYDALTTLKFKHPADQSYGVGTPNTWTKLPFNEATITGEPWLQLNPDGSFTLSAGLYFLRADVTFIVANFGRFALRQGSNFLELSNTYATNDGTAPRAKAVLSKKFAANAATFSLEIAVSNASAVSLNNGDPFLAGLQTTLAACEIYKLG